MSYVFLFTFLFSLPLIFTFMAARISHFLTAATNCLNCSCCSSIKSLLCFFISGSSSLSLFFSFSFAGLSPAFSFFSSLWTGLRSSGELGRGKSEKASLPPSLPFPCYFFPQTAIVFFSKQRACSQAIFFLSFSFSMIQGCGHDSKSTHNLT